MPSAAEVMHPYFIHIEQAVLGAAPERIDELKRIPIILKHSLRA